MNLEPNIIPFTKINSQSITDLNVKNKTIKFLQDNIGENYMTLGMVMTFDTSTKT